MSVKIQDATTADKLKVNPDGSINVILEASPVISVGDVDQGDPNTIANGWPVKPTDGTNSQSYTALGEAKVTVTQPLPAGTNALGSVTVSASALPTGAATSAAQATMQTTLNTIDTDIKASQPRKMQDGAGNALASSTSAPVGSEQALIVRNIPSGTQVVSGTVTANAGTNLNTSALALESGGHLATIDSKIPPQGQALAGASLPVVLTAAQVSTLTPPTTVTVVQSTGSSLHTNVDSLPSIPAGANAIGSVTVSNFPATQPVSGTVTANAGTGTFAVSASALPLPAGAATSAKQPALGIAGTPSTDVLTVQGAATMTALKVDGSAVTQPISAAALPLPAGAATSALQTSGNASLTSIDTKTPALGQALAGASVPVVLTATQIATLTPLSSVTVTQATGSNLHVAVDSLPSIPAGANAIGSVTVSNFPGTQAVSGTVTANAGTGTFAISAVSLPLPAGAATSAKQPAFGTAGTASADVLTIQGIASMVALKVDGSAVTQPISAVALPLPTGAATEASLAKLTLAQASTTSGQSGALIQGAVTTAAPAYTTGQTSPVSLTTAGAVRVDGSAVTQPISAAALPLPSGAATSAAQTTGNASLSSIDTKTPALGQSIQALSTPVVVPGDSTSTTGSITVQDTGSASTVQANNQTLLSGSPTAGSTFPIPTNGYSSAVVKVSGTWTGSVQVETSSDGGTTWIPLPTHIVGGSIFFLAYTANVQVECNLAGRTNVRVRAASAITGTVSVQIILSYNPTGIVFVNNAVRITDGANSSVATPLTVLAASTAAAASNTSAVVAISPNSNAVRQNDGTNNAGTFANITGAQFTATTPGQTPFGASVIMGWDGTTHREINLATDGSQEIVGNIADGTSDSGNSVKVGGVYDPTLPTLTTGQRGHLELDSNGRLITNSTPVDGAKATYSAAITGLVVAGTPTDVFTITGSASKTIRITRVAFTGSETTAAQKDVLLIKRSAANTGGTSTTPTVVPHDSASAAGTAVIRAYTANPTGLGAAVGTIRSRRVFIATTTTNSDEMIQDFGTRPAQAVVLRGTAEVLAVNLNSVASAGSLLDISIEWTEE